VLYKESSNFKVADNSGAIKLKCIGLFNGPQKKIAKLND
jgi:ribosomal protein L14